MKKEDRIMLERKSKQRLVGLGMATMAAPLLRSDGREGIQDGETVTYTFLPFFSPR